MATLRARVLIAVVVLVMLLFGWAFDALPVASQRSATYKVPRRSQTCLENLSFEGPPIYYGPAHLHKLSTRKCLSADGEPDSFYCSFTDVYIANTNGSGIDFERFIYFVVDGQTPPDLNWGPGRNFSFWTSIMYNSSRDASEEIKYTTFIPGRTLWIDWSWRHDLCHIGHPGEVFFKLLELRRQYPGKIDQIVIPKPRPKSCAFHCNILQVAFPEGVPPIVSFSDMAMLTGHKHYLQFEWLVVPAQYRRFYSSTGEVSRLRKAVLDYCAIQPRLLADAPTPKHFLFLRREVNRQITNWHKLSQQMNTQNAFEEVRVVSFDNMPFCEQMAHLNWADVLFSPHGSGLFLSAFAHEGVVVIEHFPHMMWRPDVKLVTHFANQRYLSMHTPSENCFHHEFNEFHWIRPYKICLFDWKCQDYHQNHNCSIPMTTWASYIKEAKELYGKVNQRRHCELPEAPKDNAVEYEYYFNWARCEPADFCTCCQNESCRTDHSSLAAWDWRGRPSDWMKYITRTTWFKDSLNDLGSVVLYSERPDEESAIRWERL